MKRTLKLCTELAGVWAESAALDRWHNQFIQGGPFGRDGHSTVMIWYFIAAISFVRQLRRQGVRYRLCEHFVSSDISRCLE